jgi:integrase
MMPAHIKPHPRTGYYYLIDGFYSKSLKTKSKSEAQARLKQHNRGKFGLNPVPTVGEYYETWIQTKSPPLVRASLEDDYKITFKAHILPAFRNVSLADLTAERVIEFRGKLLKGRSVKTVKNIIHAFRALYSDAQRQHPDLQGRTPFSLKWPREQKEKPDPFTAGERDGIIEWWKEHDFFYYPWVRFLFETGCRPSEAAALLVTDVNFSRRSISITKSLSRGHIGPPKTAKSNRTITIGQSLTDLITMLPSVKLGLKHLFVNKNGAPMSKKWQDHNWAEPLKKLAIPYRKFYATRHTAITELVERGRDRHGERLSAKEIADYCGTSVAMIEQSYAGRSNLDPDQIMLANQEEFEKLPKKLNENMVAGPGFEPGTSRL